MNSDLSLKRMGVWTRDGGRQMNAKEIKEKVHKGRRDRNKRSGKENVGSGGTSASGSVRETGRGRLLQRKTCSLKILRFKTRYEKGMFELRKPI